jgi:hypothetical protein
VSFPTPTALGAWLHDVVENKRRQARQTEKARLQTESKELLAQLGQLQALQASVGRWRLLAVVAVILWAVMLAWLLVGQ